MADRAKPARLQAIFFDIDDTLYSTTEFARAAREASVDAMREAGLRMARDVCLRELQEVVEEFSSNHPHHFEKLLQRVPRSAWRGTNPGVLVAAGVVAYHDTKFRQLRPYNDASEVLGLLAKTGLTLGIITDGLEVKQAEKLVRLGLLPDLDPEAIFISDQIGISKPNPKVFQKTLDTLRIPPGRAMMVGDNPVLDIDPANRVGMVTVLARRGGKWRSLRGRTRPTHEIQNFWDLLEILERRYGVKVPPERPGG